MTILNLNSNFSQIKFGLMKRAYKISKDDIISERVRDRDKPFPITQQYECLCLRRHLFVLQTKGEVGCAMLGPSCTFATFFMVE